MTPGSCIVIGVGAVFVGLLVYGTWCDPIRPWLEERRWRHDERRAERELQRVREDAGYRAVSASAVAALREQIDRDLTALRCGWFEGTAREIADLPETEPIRWLAFGKGDV